MIERADIEATVADILAEQLQTFHATVERMVAAKPVPPFVPPPIWVPGRHGAGLSVRHRNGLFFALRDNEAEPPSDAWLPLVVGIASVGFKWADERTMILSVELSDGHCVETERAFVLPFARGFWNAQLTYREGDRVVRFGDWQAAKESAGIDPNTEANDGHWIKVTGKQHRQLSLKLDKDGTLFENGEAIGSIKPLVAALLRELVPA